MAAPLFTITDLAKVYHMGEVEVHALKQVNLQLYEGQFVVLLGPSGSGKSTLLNIIGGLDVPTSGEVRYRDTVLTRADEAELTAYRRRHVGFVFQFYNLIPSLTAAENVALVTEISDAPMNPDEALRMVNLGEREDHFPAQLSGGEQQRVAIARDRQAPIRAAVRRADRCTRYLNWHCRPRGPGARQYRYGDHDGRDYAQRSDRGDGRSRHPSRRRTRHGR